MINERKTFKDFGYTSNQLSNGSHEKVWCTCQECGQERLVRYTEHKSICKICSIDRSKYPNRGPFNIEYFNSIQDSIINSSINELKTFKEFKYYSIDLSKGSERLVYAICSTCTFERTVSYATYIKTGGMCKSCSKLGISNGMFGKIGKSNPAFGRTGDKHPSFGKHHSEETRRRISAGHQGIEYDEWEYYAVDSPYCPLFNKSCRESNREKYNRECFVCGISESENITSTGKYRKLSVHHVDMNKDQECDGHEWKLIPVCMHCHGKLHTKRMQSCIEYILKEE